ncbi:MAG: hypothetical protein KDD67_10850 [Ignavibacteriae bacterium]|nr:hypothetical protein [Ignavibacteriota bacterium]
MTYHITGIVSTLLYVLSVFGLWIQLREIKRRKGEVLPERPTAIISLNAIAMAFFAYYFLFFYGFSLARFNHYLVWPRLVAIALSLAIMYEIFIDRKNRSSQITFFGCAALTLGGLTMMTFFRSTALQLIDISKGTLIANTFMLAQAGIHQIILVLRSGKTGGIALRSQQLTLAKNLGNMTFGLAMGTASGWPLVLLWGTDSLFKGILIYLFRWVKISPMAKARREG